MRSSTLTALLILILGLAAMNIYLFREVQRTRRAPVVAETGTVFTATAEDPPIRALLVFEPGQCSTKFLDQLSTWATFFETFHGSEVWVDTIAVGTSRAELGRFWEVLGHKEAVSIDPNGRFVRALGIERMPARILTTSSGTILYKEEFPSWSTMDTFEQRVLEAVAGQLGVSNTPEPGKGGTL